MQLVFTLNSTAAGASPSNILSIQLFKHLVNKLSDCKMLRNKFKDFEKIYLNRKA